MKENSKKIYRYYAAVGALLAIAPNVNANQFPGKILNGDDGDKILNHDNDEVYIDIDNDGTPDFVGTMSTYSPLSNLVFKSVYFGSCKNNAMVELNSSTDSSIKKFLFNDNIGPLTLPHSYGWLTGYSGSPEGDTPTTPLAESFSRGDDGYIGVSLPNGSGFNYGWVQVAISSVADVEFINCALENTPDTPIPAGAGATVPLLPIASAAGLGLAGLVSAYKRKKNQI